MVREIIIKIASFDWGIAIPFIVFTVGCFAIARDIEKESKLQDNVLSNGRRSRYEEY